MARSPFHICASLNICCSLKLSLCSSNPSPDSLHFISARRPPIRGKVQKWWKSTGHCSLCVCICICQCVIMCFQSSQMMESNYSHNLFFTAVWQCKRICFCSALIWVISSLMPQGFIILETYFWHFYWSLVQFVVTGVRAWGPRAFWSEFHFSRLCAHRLSTLW